jgi:hypothetical protein
MPARLFSRGRARHALAAGDLVVLAGRQCAAHGWPLCRGSGARGPGGGPGRGGGCGGAGAGGSFQSWAGVLLQAVSWSWVPPVAAGPGSVRQLPEWGLVRVPAGLAAQFWALVPLQV